MCNSNINVLPFYRHDEHDSSSNYCVIHIDENSSPRSSLAASVKFETPSEDESVASTSQATHLEVR
jgi:hypothetical protein